MNTYKKANIDKSEIINANVKFNKKFGLETSDAQKDLPSMYWIPKMHKSPIGSRFIIASKKCSNKPITEAVSNIFKMIFAHVRSFHNKSRFYSGFHKFWVVENSFPVVEKLNKINKRNNAKSISTFDFSTLYTKLPHKLLIEVLDNIIDFVFKSSTRNRIGFSKSSVYWTSKGIHNRYFTKETLKEALRHLITKCYFTVGNLVFQQIIGIPMGIDPAPFWANLFLYFFEEKYIKLLISSRSNRAYRYHGTSRFIDDLCAINDQGEFLKSHIEIYPPELELKLEHHGTSATFLDLHIEIKDNKFIYKLFDKRDKFPFFIVRLPQLNSNIPSTIFYGSIMSEFLRIARCTLNIEDFIPRAKDLYLRMVNQGGRQSTILKQLMKAFNRHSNTFQKYGISPDDIVDMLKQ